MKHLPLILIVAGITMLAYWGIDYAGNSESASIGGIEMSVREKTSPGPLILGIVTLVAGVGLRMKKKQA